MKNPKTLFVNQDNTHNRPDKAYKSAIAKIKQDGVCPFCPEQLKKYHKNPILEETTFWLATRNMYPYKGAAHHMLFIHKTHISTIEEIAPEAWSEFHDLLSVIIKKLQIKGGSFFIRFGDTKYTGASVSHLHTHIITSEPDKKDYEPILARVG